MGAFRIREWGFLFLQGLYIRVTIRGIVVVGIAALRITIGFWSPLYYNYKKELPK